jgi:cytochrome c biogenesis protein
MNRTAEAVNGQAAPRPATGVGWKEVKAELIEFFASIKLAMFLFLMIAVMATIGTVIQQNDRPEVYIKEYGEEAYRWFLRLGWTDIYHTWYFTSLLALLCINSLTCFYRRFPAIWRSMRQETVSVELPFIKSLQHTAEIPVTGTKEHVARALARYLAEKGYRVLARHDPTAVTLYATKGIMGRVGAHMAHLSATVIVLGGLIGSLWGFQEFGVCLEGQTYHIPKGNFDLRVDRFWIDYYENGAVKSYNSTLTVLEDGQEKLTKTITVNDPLVYKGIWFYQSSYGDAWDQVEMARVNVKDKATDKVLQTVDLEWKKQTTLDQLGLTMTLTDFVADFGFSSAEKRVYSKSIEHENPAIRLLVAERTSKSALEASPWIFYYYPDLFDIPGSQYRFELVGYRPRKFTGLQITKDPGVSVVWVGSTMIVVGIALSSFIYHRRLWFKVIPEVQASAHGPRVVVHVGGTTHKNQIDFAKEFKKLRETISTLKA